MVRRGRSFQILGLFGAAAGMRRQSRGVVRAGGFATWEEFGTGSATELFVGARHVERLLVVRWINKCLWVFPSADSEVRRYRAVDRGTDAEVF